MMKTRTQTLRKGVAAAGLAVLLGMSLVGCGAAASESGSGGAQASETSEGAQASAVRTVVEKFGQRLKEVSLLAPKDIAALAMAQSYGPWVTPDLLARWQAHPELALGRLTSSPWPDRIEIRAVTRQGDGSYKVEGDIVLVTGIEATSGGAAGRTPVILEVRRTAEGWRIADVTVPVATIAYTDTQYGFTFTLPASWAGYRIVESQWEGLAIDGPAAGQVVERGPLISIRHPQWTAEHPRQDIPIMVFTTAQWAALQDGRFHIGAAPIGPSELGRNSHYVFALPARYNYAFPEGWEEVEGILSGHPLQPTEPSH